MAGANEEVAGDPAVGSESEARSPVDFAAELSPRELAICRGEDPDAIESPASSGGGGGDATTDEVAKDGGAEVEASAGGAKDGAGNEAGAQDAGGGKDAAWVDDGVRSLAESYGWSDEEVASFSNVEEFRRAAVLFSKHLMATSAGADSGQEPSKAGSAAGKADTVSGNDGAAGAAGAKPDNSLDDLDPERWKAANYDEETVRVVAALRDERVARLALEKEVATIRSWHEQELHRQQAVAFHALADKLDPEFFGDSKKLTPEGQARREKLWNAVGDLAGVIEAHAAREGRKAEMPGLEVLLDQAKEVAFGKELRELDRRRFQERAEAQSRRRRPAAMRAKAPAPSSNGGRNDGKGEAVEDVVRAIADNPEVRKVWEKGSA